MKKQYLLFSVIITGILGLTMMTGPFLFFSEAVASPASTESKRVGQLQPLNTLEYISVSGLGFEPIHQNIAYTKDAQRQLLSLAGQSSGSNIFIASLSLPDRSQLMGMTIFGEDFDFQGEIRARFKRCDHGQPRCVTLAETNSTLGFAAGQFETARVDLLGEIVDNRLYSYFLEVELTTLLNNSGLRSVRVELAPAGTVTSPGEQEQWSLAGDVRSFPVPNLGLAQVKICTDDLSHLNNVTHNPYVVVDEERIIPLSSNSCVTVWGEDIEIQRRPNTGPSSGSYQILR
jgi:hypothetical protein